MKAEASGTGDYFSRALDIKKHPAVRSGDIISISFMRGRRKEFLFRIFNTVKENSSIPKILKD